MTLVLPPYVDWKFVEQRLQTIFPPGQAERAYLTREMAGKTVFVMLYIGAVQGTDRYLAPRQVFRMTDEQAEKNTDAARIAYAEESLQRGFKPPERTWYAENSREPIRDETLRKGLVAVGAVTDRIDLPKTHGGPRYALTTAFAALFDPAVTGSTLDQQVEQWQAANLAAAARARMTLIRSGANLAGGGQAVVLSLPDGSRRPMSSGESSLITKQVVEEFAPRFLATPAVVFISESGQKVIASDMALSRQLGLKIDAAKVLPDVILADLGATSADLLLVFVEVVHTDGPVNDLRRTELLRVAEGAQLDASQIAFVTAYMDRNQGEGRAALARVALNTFVWFATEPDALVALFDTKGSPRLLRRLASQ